MTIKEQKEVIEKIKKNMLKVAKLKDMTESDITTSTRLIDDLAFDSITTIELIVELEDCFDIEFDDELLLYDNFKTFGDFCAMVNNVIENTYKH